MMECICFIPMSYSTAQPDKLCSMLAKKSQYKTFRNFSSWMIMFNEKTCLFAILTATYATMW